MPELTVRPPEADAGKRTALAAALLFTLQPTGRWPGGRAGTGPRSSWRGSVSGWEGAGMRSRAGSSGVAFAVQQRPSMLAGPRLDVGPLPDLAHVELGLGRRPVVTPGELLDPLSADAEHPADLGRPDKVVHGGNHSHDDSSHLTSGQAYGRLVT